MKIIAGLVSAASIGLAVFIGLMPPPTKLLVTSGDAFACAVFTAMGIVMGLFTIHLIVADVIKPSR